MFAILQIYIIFSPECISSPVAMKLNEYIYTQWYEFEKGDGKHNFTQIGILFVHAIRTNFVARWFSCSLLCQ